jgi:hypothetical protein
MENKKLENLLIGLTLSLVVLIVLALLVRATCFSYVENYQVAYLFDKRTGNINKMVNEDGSLKIGYVFNKPVIEEVYTVDTRPIQICISANSRVLNCKLVSFNPDGYDLFISWHGIGNYNNSEGSLRFKDILMSYAFDPNVGQDNYPFLNILKTNDIINKNVKDSIQ